jgi:hypothetical protein
MMEMHCARDRVGWEAYEFKAWIAIIIQINRDGFPEGIAQNKDSWQSRSMFSPRYEKDRRWLPRHQRLPREPASGAASPGDFHVEISHETIWKSRSAE